ncbi:MAG: hypothetical protein NC398_10525, partial [Acetatifactor muris]|nr:hypothetical protein [Acetatifactor muris]
AFSVAEKADTFADCHSKTSVIVKCWCEIKSCQLDCAPLHLAVAVRHIRLSESSSACASTHSPVF